MVIQRIRRPIYDKWGRVTGSINEDNDLGEGRGGIRMNAATAMPVGHMNPGKGLKGITQVQQAGLGDLKDSRFNGAINPANKRDAPQ